MLPAGVPGRGDGLRAPEVLPAGVLEYVGSLFNGGGCLLAETDVETLPAEWDNDLVSNDVAFLAVEPPPSNGGAFVDRSVVSFLLLFFLFIPPGR